MAVIIEVISPVESSGEATDFATVVEVVKSGESSPTPTVTGTAAIDVVVPGGTVANVQWGYDFPASPTEGQIFLKVTP